MRCTTIELFCCGLGFLINAEYNPSFGQQPSNADALELITKTADKICQSAPLEETSSGTQLSGDAKAKLGGVIGKIADLQISGVGEHKSEKSNGLLQKDQIAALQSSNNCKLSVFQTLEQDLLATYDRSSQFGVDGNKNSTVIYKYYGFSKSASIDLNRIEGQELGSGNQQMAHNFSFTIKGCLATQADSVSCPITVENNGSDRTIYLGGAQNENYIIDEAGLTHPITAIELGSSHSNPAQTLAPNGVPLRGVVTYGGNGQPVQGKISRLIVHVSFVVMWFPVKWENVEVTR